MFERFAVFIVRGDEYICLWKLFVVFNDIHISYILGVYDKRKAIINSFLYLTGFLLDKLDGVIVIYMSCRKNHKNGSNYGLDCYRCIIFR